MCQAHNETSNNVRNRTAKSRENKNVKRNGKLQVLTNIRSRHNQTSRDKKNKNKNNKRLPQMDEEISRNQTMPRKSHQKNKYLGSYFVRYSEPFLNSDKWTRWQENYWRCARPYILEITQWVYLREVKKEEEDSKAWDKACRTQKLDKKSKAELILAASNSSYNLRKRRKTIYGREERQ